MPPKHSIKVPKLYKVATSILKNYKDGQGSVKTLVYEAKKKHPNVKALFALVTECIKHEEILNTSFSKIKLLENESPLDKNLALILATELIYGKKKTLPGESRPVLTLLKYQKELEKCLGEENNTEENKEIIIQQPRYVRVNLLKTTMDLVLAHLKREGLILKPNPENYEKFLQYIVNLEEHEFMIDFHLSGYLLVFPSKTQFYDYPLYIDGSLILQDKASCLTVAALDPPQGCTILDACSAPGMKTSQALAMIQPNGNVIAIERDVKRFKVLNELLEKHCNNKTERIDTLNSDFLKLNPEEFPNVDYIIVDPTCSGSGLNKIEKNSERLKKLSNLQVMILKHALKFPAVKKVAYSTCSIFEEENEKVINEVLEDHGHHFKLVKKIMPNWQRRSVQNKCLKVDPELDCTSGFFVAVLKKK